MAVYCPHITTNESKIKRRDYIPTIAKNLLPVYNTPVKMKLIIKIIIFLLIPLISLSSCSNKREKHDSGKQIVTDNVPAYGDTIIEGTIGEPSILIPMLAGDSSSHEIAGLIFNGLVKYDKDLTITGDLAESWDISKDGLVITFHLRKGVRWTDGKDFTAEDVMFGYKTIIDEKTPTAYSEDFKQVKKAELIDKYTFRVTYDKPFAPALSSWGNLPVLPKHLLEGKDITKSDLTRNPIGMGPFKLVKWVPGQEVVLESNKDYFEGRPYIDRYVYRIIPDQATMFLELQAGGIDWMGITPTQYQRQTETSYFRNNFNKYKYPVFAYTYIGFNLCLKKDKSGKCVAVHPMFGDKKVRQAVAYAIDKEELVGGVLFGLGKPATGPYVPNTWPYNPDVKKYEYSIDKAKALLAEAGWKDTDRDGLLDKDGRKFEFTILTNMGNTSRMKTSTIIQYRLGKLGIKVNIRALEWSTFINEFIDKRRFEAVVLGWSIGLDPDQYDIWHSSKTKEKEFNFVNYANPEVDDLLEKGRRTFDINERKKIYFRIQDILADELPYIFLYVPDALPIISSRFHGIEPAPIGIGYNLPEWYVPKEQQKHKIQP